MWPHLFVNGVTFQNLRHAVLISQHEQTGCCRINLSCVEKYVWADGATEMILRLTACFRRADAQFLRYVFPGWERQRALWAFGGAPAAGLHAVVKVDGEAGGVLVLLGRRRLGVGEKAVVMRRGGEGGSVHVWQKDTGHVMLTANVHLSGDARRRRWADIVMLVC